MTKSELAAQKCADLTENIAPYTAFRRYVEHVSDLCEQSIATGDTSGLNELVLREPVDPDLLEAREIAAQGCDDCLMPATAHEIRNGVKDKSREVKTALAALRRGREIERGEGK